MLIRLSWFLSVKQMREHNESEWENVISSLGVCVCMSYASHCHSNATHRHKFKWKSSIYRKSRPKSNIHIILICTEKYAQKNVSVNWEWAENVIDTKRTKCRLSCRFHVTFFSLLYAVVVVVIYGANAHWTWNDVRRKRRTFRTGSECWAALCYWIIRH